MSGMEVLGCVGAVVSAFYNAAETLQIVKDRKEKKKRKKEKEVEELIEIKLLHKSLVEGATQCRRSSEDKHRRFGPAFDVGDAIATSALKDVVITLQSEVIQALQIAKAVENAVLDLTSLHESSITCRKDATRAMDQLCQRMMDSFQNSPRHDNYDSRGSFSSNRRSTFGSIQQATSPALVESYPPLPPAVSIPGYGHDQRQIFQHRSSTAEGMVVQGEMFQTSHRSVFSWTGGMPNIRGGMRAIAPSTAPDEEEHDVRTVQDYPDVERMSQLSIQDSALGSEISSNYWRSSSVTSGATDPRQSSVSSSIPEQPPQYIQSEHGPPHQLISGDSKNRIRDDDLTPESSDSEEDSLSGGTALPRPSDVSDHLTPSTSATIQDVSRAAYAPEVVTKEFESLLSQSHGRSSSSPMRSSHLANVHPANRYPNVFLESPAPPDPDYVWLPLTRPGRHNNYHGFCKGAWQIRKSVQEGLSIQMIPNDKGENVPHWTCKLCQFRSRALNMNALPDQIFFNSKCGVRYRWLFLAKSHVAAVGTFKKVENYQYGCIFCAAEGRPTATHEKLDSLMMHILSKHKTYMMTSETKDKTKCIVGGAPDRDQDWDINLPESKPSGPGKAVGEFVVSAVTGLSRYGS